jgi:tetratricopeptide (TPR) repeat protein
MEAGKIQLDRTPPLQGGCPESQPSPSANEKSRLVRAAGRIGRALLAIPIAVGRHPGRSAVILVLLLCILGGFAMIGTYLWASYHLRAARSAVERYHTREAIPHLQASLSIWHRDPETLLLAARAARRMDSFEEADRFLDQYQQVRGAEDETLILERVLLRADRGDIDSVSDYCYSLIKQDHPDTPLVLESLSRGFLNIYRVRDAESTLNEWIRRQPENAQPYFIQAQVYDLQARLTDAVSSYRRVLTIDPDRDDARLGLCVCLLQLGLAEEAGLQLEYLRKRMPDDLMVRVYLARAYDRLDRLDEAESLLDAVLERQPRFAAALAERGKLAMRAGQNEQAEKWLREAVQLDPNDYATQYQLVLCLERNDKQDELQKERARLQAIEDDIKQIRMISTVQMQMAPHDPELHYQVGMISLRAKAVPEALRWFHSALKEDPNHAPTHKALMEYYESIGDFGRAREHRLKAGKLDSAVSGGGNGKVP